jgi:1-aminocyclopropane-1-carboxylate deaminase
MFAKKFLMLKFNPNFLKKIDLSHYNLEVNSFYIYMDNVWKDGISGNKIRKLYGNLEEAKKRGLKTLITIGGNYSNHLHAASFIPEMYGLDIVAIVKGHRPKTFGYTLEKLASKNIPIYFFPKHEIKENLNNILDTLYQKYPESFFIPEGGTNEFSSLGFKELCNSQISDFQTICTPAGTGGTAIGIKKYTNAKVRAYAALQDFSLIEAFEAAEIDYTFEYTLGGYAKYDKQYIDFLLDFEQYSSIQLDPIYTGKMIWGIIEDFKKGILKKNDAIVAIHTGGLQGWHGIKC